jgi:hypothetical protein
MTTMNTNTGYNGRPSTVCMTCASHNRLRFLPCEDHYPAIPSDVCEHNRTTVIFIHNGTGIHCYDCGSQTYNESEN